jgi:hypothetical protein
MFCVDSLAYHVRREGIDFRSRFSLRIILVHLAIIAVFGIWWPHIRGTEFFDPVFLAAYACLGVLFAGPAAAQAFANRPQSVADAFARIALAAVYGEAIALIILIAGIATVLIARTSPIGPDWIGLAFAAVLGFTGAVAMASVAAWFALRFSPGVARQALRVLFLGLLVLFFFESRWLPDVIGRGISICAGIAILAFFQIRGAVARIMRTEDRNNGRIRSS